MTCEQGNEVVQYCSGGPACTLSKPGSVRAYSGAVGACTCQTAESVCPEGTRMESCLCRIEQADIDLDMQSPASDWEVDSEEDGENGKNFKPPPPSVSWALTSVEPKCGNVCKCHATNIKPIYAGKAPDRLVAEAMCMACAPPPPAAEALPRP